MTEPGLPEMPATAGADDSRPNRWRASAVALAIGTVIGLAIASQWVLSSRSYGRPVAWSVALVTQLREAWLWVLLVPAVFAVSRRFPLQRGSWGRAIPAHVLSALLASMAYSAMNTALLEWLTPDQLRPAFWSGPRRPPPGPPPGEKPGERPGERPAAPEPPPIYQRFWFGFSTRMHLNCFTYALIAVIWHWLDHQRRLRDRDRQARELSRQLAEARLQALRMQLNPHFLFNTLNAIATLVHRHPDAADEMIACLSDFLRLTLSAQNKPEAPLRTELEFARRYLDIEKVRFGERLTVREEIATDCLGVSVPSLVLQPLLENAVRHGIERSEEPGRIELSAHREAGQLVLRVSNTGPLTGPTQDARRGGSGGGVGLANTRARLRELHGDDAALALVEREGGGLNVEIRVPCHDTAVAANHPA